MTTELKALSEAVHALIECETKGMASISEGIDEIQASLTRHTDELKSMLDTPAVSTGPCFEAHERGGSGGATPTCPANSLRIIKKQKE